MNREATKNGLVSTFFVLIILGIVGWAFHSIGLLETANSKIDRYTPFCESQDMEIHRVYAVGKRFSCIGNGELIEYSNYNGIFKEIDRAFAVKEAS